MTGDVIWSFRHDMPVIAWCDLSRRYAIASILKINGVYQNDYGFIMHGLYILLYCIIGAILCYLTNYFRYNDSLSLHSITMQRYAYRKGLLPTLALVMQYNITALIYAVSENALFIGRHVDVPNHETTTKVQQRVNKSGCVSVILNSNAWSICVYTQWRVISAAAVFQKIEAHLCLCPIVDSADLM